MRTPVPTGTAMSIPRPRILLLVLFGFCVGSPEALSQTIALSGRVSEAETGRPLAGVLVTAHDSEGRRIRGGFTGSDGTFRLPLPAGIGEVEVRGEFIGYRAASSGLLPVEEARSGILLEMRPRPVEVDPLLVVGERRCEIEADAGHLAWRYWSDALTALRAALVTEDEALVRFRVMSRVRELDHRERPLRTLEEHEWIASGPPFHALPPAELTEGGFIQVEGDTATRYYAPDARVLLSEEFAETHCLEGAEDHGGQVGIRFMPVPDTDVPGIEGTMWIDEETGRLRQVEYDYVIPGHPQAEPGGGRIEFRALPEGPWIVERWAIRMRVADGPGGARFTLELMDRLRQAMFLERGGEVVEILGSRTSR